MAESRECPGAPPPVDRRSSLCGVRSDTRAPRSRAFCGIGAGALRCRRTVFVCGSKTSLRFQSSPTSIPPRARSELFMRKSRLKTQ
eukprot:4184604-Prymnesium_polylepis.1